MIKNKHKTRKGSKTLSFRDIRLKILPATKAIGWNLLMKRTNIKRSYMQFTKMVKISPRPLFNAQKNKKIQGIQIVIYRLSQKLSIFPSICIKSFMPTFNRRISPESLSVEF
jgi:hypothetical protein